METESWPEAKENLVQLENSTKNKMALALIAQSLGQIAIHQDDMLEALKQFKASFAFSVLDEAGTKSAPSFCCPIALRG